VKSVLVLSRSDMKRDPRVHRQLAALASRYRVTALGLGDPEMDGVSFHAMAGKSSLPARLVSPILLASRSYEAYYWSRGFVRRAMKALADHHFDVIIANDLPCLPLAIALGAGRSRVIFDAHEYSPREFEDQFRWRLLYQGLAQSLCERYLRHIDGMMTVCQGISDEYRRVYGVPSVVVTNAPRYHDLEPKPVGCVVFRMLHHGGAMPERRLDDMIETMRYLDDRFRLDFMLTVAPGRYGYLRRLQKLARGDPRIRFIPPVPMPMICHTCNEYDIGLFLLRPLNFNYEQTLPNKLFEFIQGRVAVAIGPSPEMGKLVRNYDCGIVADDFTPRALARALSALTKKKIEYYKLRSHEAARELSAERNAGLIIDLVEGR
jgi:glycosyltransferase involved in cell wall biosynthesis